MQGDLHVTAAAADRLASTAETISPLVLNERRIVLDEMSRQRALVMDAISVEREQAVSAIVRAFAAERGEVLRNVDSERLATLEWATNERRESIAELRRELAASVTALRAERVVVVDDAAPHRRCGFAAHCSFHPRRGCARPARRSRLRSSVAAAMTGAALLIPGSVPEILRHSGGRKGQVQTTPRRGRLVINDLSRELRLRRTWHPACSTQQQCGFRSLRTSLSFSFSLSFSRRLQPHRTHQQTCPRVRTPQRPRSMP